MSPSLYSSESLPHTALKALNENDFFLLFLRAVHNYLLEYMYHFLSFDLTSSAHSSSQQMFVKCTHA